MREELEIVKNKCEVCKKCPLHLSRNNIVFADGIDTAHVMLIGEAPGESEDLQGKPFVGRSGQLLDKILESADLSREKNVYICNTIKCRPPKNRNPEDSEKEKCREYLDRQIEVIKPKVILLVGAVAVKSMIPENKLGITKIHGTWFDGPNNSKMMPIYHPAYLLRNASNDVGKPKWQTLEDLKEVKRYIDSLK